MEDELDKQHMDRYKAARNALTVGKGKNEELLNEYIQAASAVRHDVESMAKRLSQPKGLPRVRRLARGGNG